MQSKKEISLITKTIYESITEKILEELSKGSVPWKKPWSGGKLGIPRRWDGTPYRGYNLFWLGLKPLKYPFYFGIKTIHKLGGRIIPGEFLKHSYTVFWKVTNEKNEKGVERQKFLLRSYKVWHYEQLTGIVLPKALQEIKSQIDSAHEKKPDFEAAESIIKGYKDAPEIKVGADHAAYTRSKDLVEIPGEGRFGKKEEYYATLFHELVHSTGHQKRLGREEARSVELYSREELIAEFGSSFLMGSCGLSSVEDGVADATHENAAAYIKGWSEKIKAEPSLVIRAAQDAAKAVDYILGKSYDHKGAQSHGE